MTMEELTLFDLGEIEVEEKKEAPKKGKRSSSGTSVAAKPKAPVEPKPEVNVTGEWTIHFATETFNVSDFVKEIPEEGVTLEQVREEMEKNFAQFSAARTKWDVDEENKRLFPDAFAGSKGGDSFTRAPFFTSSEEAQSFEGRLAYFPGDDGQVYEVRNSSFGRMVAKTSSIPQLPKVDTGFTYYLPKIPSKILGQILSFFKAYSAKGKFEVMLRIYWDTEEDEYVVECPEQVVTSIRIDCKYDPAYTGRNSLRYHPILEIHSHNVMRAFFSETDDMDEQRYGLYAVVGRCDREQIEIIMRAKANDSQVAVPIKTVFDVNLSDVETVYPKEWDEKVTLKGWGA